MKKRILALALAGTTAFSVFGGLNVFASTKDDVYDSYTPSVVWYVLNSVDANKVPTGNVEVNGTTDFSIETAMDFDDVMEVEVADGDTAYLYDFFDYYIDTKNYTVSKVEAALDSEDNALGELAAILAGGEPSDTAYQVGYETGYGERRTIRKEVVDAFEDFLDEISLDKADYDYLFEKKDIYNFEGLLDDLKAASAGYVNMYTSELVYLMQQYDYFVEGGLVDATEYDTDALEIVLEILNGRTEGDFKSANTYNRDWVFKMEDLMDDYDDADTTAEYNDVWETAIDYLFNTTGAATADKADLKSAMTSTLLGYDLYPAADYKVSKTEYTDEYDYYLDVLTFAGKINDLSRTKSFQSDIDYVTEMLNDAIDALEPTTEPKASTVMTVEEALEDVDGLIASDYKSGWSNFEKALAYAEDVLDGAGDQQTKNAPKILAAAEKALVAKSIPMSLKKELKAAINEATKWIDKYEDNYTADKNAAQVLAVVTALEDGEDVYGDIGKGALISEVEAAIDAINAALDYSAVVQGWAKTDAGWTYGTEDGYLNNGWAKIGAVWYYFDADGTAKESEWLLDNGKWYYFTSGCNAVAANWAQVNGKWYYFDHSCAMVTGWLWNNNCWYYLDASGAMVTNTVVDGYTIGADGVML